MNDNSVKRFKLAGSRIARCDPSYGIARFDPVSSLTMQIDFSTTGLGMCGILEVENQDLNLGAFPDGYL
jgi:hypothetical protein